MLDRHRENAGTYLEFTACDYKLLKHFANVEMNQWGQSKSSLEFKLSLQSISNSQKLQDEI